MTEILLALAVKAIRNEEGPDRIAEIAEITALAKAAINQQTDIFNNLEKMVDDLF